MPVVLGQFYTEHVHELLFYTSDQNSDITISISDYKLLRQQ